MANEPSEATSRTPHPRGGRPKKYPDAGKTGYLGFRLPEEEIKAIEDAANAVGESVSEYVRKAITLRMKERKPLLPTTSISYTIFPVRIDDNKLSTVEAPLNKPTEVKSITIVTSAALGESSQKED